jgi:hypothetical protein
MGNERRVVRKRMRNRWVLTALAGMALVASMLACNAPTETPSIAASPRQATAPPAATDVPASPPSLATETAAPTETPSPTDDPVAGATPTAAEATGTATPTVTPTVTPTEPVRGEPLEISNGGFEIVDWEPLPDDGEWEGHLRIVFTGGAPPYQYALEGSEPQDENHLTVRWRRCRNAPLTVRILSSDGQEASKQIWVVSPYCPESDQ